MTHRRENVELRYRALYVCYARREGGRKRQKQTESKSESKIGREREKARERERERAKKRTKDRGRIGASEECKCLACLSMGGYVIHISVSHTTYQ